MNDETTEQQQNIEIPWKNSKEKTLTERVDVVLKILVWFFTHPYHSSTPQWSVTFFAHKKFPHRQKLSEYILLYIVFFNQKLLEE